ncbi:hypothetical protein [Flavobacterium rhizosphaerae]|uniref:Uncharacterized protein n=1 Tax=Flavobacterium rhizosphaerae TaxID=3163298 RepID=A0ABW8YXD6_9FLAO
MKKKLEGELISIAHRVLKLKNKSQLDQLMQETQKLYQALAVLKFVEDNFGEIKPGTEQASALGKLEEIYGVAEIPAEAKPEGNAIEKDNAAEEAEEKENTETENNEVVGEPEIQKEAEAAPEPEAVEEASRAIEEEKEEKEEKTPQVKVQVEKPEEDIKKEESSAQAVFTNAHESKAEEVEQAADAEIKTIEPDAKAKTDEEIYNFEFAFERKGAPDEKEDVKPSNGQIGLEDFHNYKEPEFIRKCEEEKTSAQAEEQTEGENDDWRNWEPSKSPYGNKTETPKPETTVQETPKTETPKQPEPLREEPKASRSLNDSLGKVISLGLNDRIAFEKHLFAGSSEDLNRVISQLNTIDNFKEAQRFVQELIKPDYNNWAGKEEYEERFMSLIEKKYD